MQTATRIAVLGGCGLVGLPLAITFAARQFDVTIVDTNRDAVAEVNAGRMAFMDRGADELLRVHAGKNLHATTDPHALTSADTVICVIGTPIDVERSMIL